MKPDRPRLRNWTLGPCVPREGGRNPIATKMLPTLNNGRNSSVSYSILYEISPNVIIHNKVDTYLKQSLSEMANGEATFDEDVYLFFPFPLSKFQWSILSILNSILTKKIQYFHEFFTQFFWQSFSWNQSCQQLKSPKPQHFHEFSPKTIRQFFSGNQSWIFEQKMKIPKQCARMTSAFHCSILL